MVLIGKFREENCITQKQLADASGLNVRWIQKLESGEIDIKNITVLNMVKLLRGLNELAPSQAGEKDYEIFMIAYSALRKLLEE